MKAHHLFIALLPVLVATSPVYPAACVDTWSNAVGTVGELDKDGSIKPGTLEIKDDVQLFNTGDHELATGELKVNDKDPVTFCDAQPCVAGGTDAVMLSVAEPPAPPDTEIPDADDLKLKNDALVLSSGTHDFKNLELDGSTITSSGAGALTINVSGNLKIEDFSALTISQSGPVTINVGGDLVIDKNSTLSISGAASVTINVSKQLKITDASMLTIGQSGPVTIRVGDDQEIKDNSTLRVSESGPVRNDVSGKLTIEKGSTLDYVDAGQVITHVGDDLEIKDSQVNANEDALDLIFLVAGKAKIEGEDKADGPADVVNAIIYAAEDLEVKGGVEITGALVGGEKAKIEKAGKRSPIITYVDTSELEIEGLCGAAPAADPDHFRLLHDGSGIVGIPETVTIQACVDADCMDLYTGSVTVTLEPGNGATSWSGVGVVANEVTFTGGSHTLEITHTAAGTIDIGLTATPAPTNGTRCYVAAVENCALTFVVPTFTLTLPDQVSGDPSVGALVVSDCWPDFQSQTIAVAVAAQYLSPASVGPAVTVNGTALPIDGSATSVTFTFDAGCNAPIQVDYTDAGRIGLSVDYMGTGPLSGLNIIGSQSVVFYPAALVVEARNLSGTVLDATAAGASPIHTAGAPFALRITAVNSAGVPTMAYQPEAANRVLVYAERTGPKPGAEGVLQVSPGTSVSTQGTPPTGPADYQVSGIETGDFVAGAFEYLSTRYNEVGLLTLYTLDTDYMGHPITAAPVPIGRFVPAAFLVSGGVTNRFATAGCSGDSFTYLDEPLRTTVTLTAVNALNSVTANYRDGFASIDGSGFGAFGSAMPNTLGIRSTTNLSDRLTIRSMSAGGWAGGSLNLDFDLEVGRAALPDGPHDGSVIGVAHGGDDDGVGLESLDTDIDGAGGNDHVQVANVNLRYGRLAVGNAHGSERRDLDVPVAIQIYGGVGVGFVNHVADDCTWLQAIALSDAAGGGSLPAATCVIEGSDSSGAFGCPSGTPGNPYDGEADGGTYVVNLKAPGADDTGAVHVAAQTRVDADWRFDQDWARFDWSGGGTLTDPRGLATFGIYNRNSGVIFQREVR